MAINKKLIHFKKQQTFEQEVANGNILDNSIVFIQDSKEISTHGTVYKTVNWSILEGGVSDGVYAVSSTGSLIDYNSADATAIGVAIVAGEHKFMIAKSDASNDGSNYDLYWIQEDVAGIVNNNSVDGLHSIGGLPKPDGSFADYVYHLSGDFTTWTAGALSDFNGKANTDAIINSYTEHGVSMNDIDMCFVLNTFNESDSYKDWYIPALGQLALIYLNKTEINAALAKIGGIALTDSYYWASSEIDFYSAWNIFFRSGQIGEITKDEGLRVRFVRDLQ